MVLRDSDQPSSTRDGTYRAPTRGRAPSARGRAPASTSNRRIGKRLGDLLPGTPSKRTEKGKDNNSVEISVEVENKEEEVSTAID